MKKNQHEAAELDVSPLVHSQLCELQHDICLAGSFAHEIFFNINTDNRSAHDVGKDIAVILSTGSHEAQAAARAVLQLITGVSLSETLQRAIMTRDDYSPFS